MERNRREKWAFAYEVVVMVLEGPPKQLESTGGERCMAGGGGGSAISSNEDGLMTDVRVRGGVGIGLSDRENKINMLVHLLH